MLRVFIEIFRQVYGELVSMSNAESEEIRGVRVRFSTIINYVSHLYRLVIAVLFAVVITRRLSIEEYGLFTTIIALTTLFSLIYDVWNFWIIRYSARKRYELVSSSLFINIVYVIISATPFFLLSNYYVEVLGTEFTYFYIGYFIILVSLFLTYLRSISLSSKPFIDGVVSIIEHSVRLLFAYLLVVVFSFRVLGALITVVLTIAIGSLMYYLFLKRHGVYIPKPSFNMKRTLLILKNSYISTISTLYEFLRQLERPLLTAITNSPLPAAYLGVSYVPRSVMLQSSAAFTASLSARLLRKPVKEDIDYTLRLCIVINTGVLLVTLIFSKSILSLFRREYIEASILFILFSLESYIYIFLNIFISIASSIEREDLEKFGLKLLSTALFKLRFYMFLTGLLVILSSSIALTTLLFLRYTDPIVLSLPYPVAWLISSILLSIYSYKVALSKIEINIPWLEVIYSTVSSIVAGLTAVAFGLINITIYHIWIDLPKLIISVIAVLAIYFSILVVLSKWFRDLVKTIAIYLLSIFK